MKTIAEIFLNFPEKENFQENSEKFQENFKNFRKILVNEKKENWKILKFQSWLQIYWT